MSSISIATEAPSVALASAEEWVLSVLEERLNVSGLQFADSLTSVPNGWETHTLTFRLAPTRNIPHVWQRPVILRAYSSMAGLARARHEHTTQKYVRRLGYPVAQPLAFVEEASPWGGPAWFMERLEGRTMLEALEANPFRLWGLPREMASTHARLHELPTEGLGVRRADLFTHMATIIDDHDLTGFVPGLDWLMENEPPPPKRESIVHFDFHPLNLIDRPDGSLAVLDWSDAEVGDPDADVAATCLLLECGPTEPLSSLSQLFVPLARAVILRRYLSAYRRIRPIDEARLSYFRAWAALRRLCDYSQWIYGDTGSKPSSVNHLTPEYLARLCHYFQAWSGVAVRVA
jgi:aminoglycoside phosphotransferase (APT) family kinase protein